MRVRTTNGRRSLPWAIAVVVLAAATAAAFVHGARVRAGLIDDATASAEELVRATLVPEIRTQDVASPGSRYEVLAAVSQEILAGGDVESLALWDPDGTILFAEDAETIGNQVRSMRATLTGVTGSDATSDVRRGLIRTFVPYETGKGARVIVEVDRSYEPVRTATDPWRLLTLATGIAAVLAAIWLIRGVILGRRRGASFDAAVPRAAAADLRRAERDRAAAEERRSQIERELERVRAALKEAEDQARAAKEAAGDAPRLREQLASMTEDVHRSEGERARLQAGVAETAEAAQAAARAREETRQLELARSALEERAARAEATAAELAHRVEELETGPQVEGELAAAREAEEAAHRATAEERARAERSEQRVRELEETLRELRKELERSADRPDLSTPLEAATSELAAAREQIRGLTAKADEADAEASRLRTELDGRDAARSRELSELGQQLAAARAELEAATSDLVAERSRTQDLTEETDSLRRQAGATEALITGANGELQLAVEQIRALTERAQLAEAGLELARAEGSEALGTLLRELEGTKGELERAKGELEAVRGGTEASRGEIEAARAELKSTVSDRDAIAAELAAAREDAVAARREVDAQRERFAIATASTDAARAETTAARSDAETAKADAETAKAEAEAAKAEAEAAKAEAEAAKAEAEAAKAEAETARAEAETARAEAEASKAEAEADSAVNGAEAARGETGRARADAVAAKEALAASTKELEALRSVQAAHGAEVAELTKGLEAARSALEDLRERAGDADRLAGRVAELEAKLTRATERAEVAERAFAEVERAVAALPPELFTRPRPRSVPAATPAPTRHIEPAPSASPGSTNGNGHRPEAPEPIEVDTLVRRLVQEKWSHGARVVSVYAEPASVEIGVRDLESILDALLRRSLQHTHEDAQLGVHVERRGDGVLLSVEDGGPESPEAISSEVARLATLHGGRASVEPRPGGGSVVSVFLPRRAGQAASVRTD